MNFEHFERGYLLPKGCKDLIDVITLLQARPRVINSILLEGLALGNVPEYLGNVGPGLLLITDQKQKSKPLVEPGSTVRVHRPDGTFTDRIAAAIEVWGPHLGLFFPETAQHEIPVSSEIELLA